MPRLKSQNKAIRDERRSKILQASIPLFAIYGQNSVSMDMVCNASDCSHGLIYHYFDNIDELYSNALNSEFVLEMKNKIYLVREEPLASQELYRITKNILFFAGKDKNTKAALLLMLNDETKTSIFETLNKLIEQGQKEKDVVGGEPEEIAKAYLYILKGYLLNCLLNKKFNEPVPNIDIVYEILRKRSRM